MDETYFIPLAVQILCPAIIALIGVGLGFIAGSRAEKAHFARLEKREAKTAHILVTDIRVFDPGMEPARGGRLVMGEVVIASDYFKNLRALLMQIVGGELAAYQPLMIRARREAMVRLKEEAVRQRCNAVANLRMETSNINVMARRPRAAMVAVLAYGTAYAIKPAPNSESDEQP